MLRDVQNAITAVYNGGTFVIGSTTYSNSDIETLQQQERILGVKAAIQAIEEGGQSFQHGDRTYTRADLQTLYARLDKLEGRAIRTAAGGARVRRVVPI